MFRAEKIPGDAGGGGVFPRIKATTKKGGKAIVTVTEGPKGSAGRTEREMQLIKEEKRV